METEQQTNNIDPSEGQEQQESLTSKKIPSHRMPDISFLQLKKIVNEMDEVNPDPKKFFEIRIMANTLLNRAKRVRRANGAEERLENDRAALESTELAQKKKQENIDILNQLEQLERSKKQLSIEYQVPGVKAQRALRAQRQLNRQKRLQDINAESSSDSEDENPAGEQQQQQQPKDDDPATTEEPSLVKKQKGNEEEETTEEQANNKTTKVLKDGAIFHMSRAKRCYVCHQKYNRVHKFYHSMCITCGNFNFEKRECIKPDLTGMVAIVTGGRIKIGYLSSLLLLRAGCSVHVTSRFPKDTLDRYKKEPDFAQFQGNLQIYGLDFRDVGSVMKFCEFFKQSVGKLDILINNAAQCVRRSPSYFKYLLDIESTPLKDISEADLKVFQNDLKIQDLKQVKISSDSSANLSEEQKQQNYQEVQKYAHVHLADSVLMNLKPVIDGEKSSNDHLYPMGIVDSNGIQVDLAEKNSWTAKIDEVPVFEFMETQVINSWVPFILCQQLLPCMTGSPEQLKANKYIVNVSSVEGKFHMTSKPTAHPHNNMSKASLNMLTRTVGPQYAKDYNIFMTCVDTGWVSNDMIPQSFVFDNVYRATPLDELDGALRVIDPVFEGVKTKKPIHTVFLQNYNPCEW